MPGSSPGMTLCVLVRKRLELTRQLHAEPSGQVLHILPGHTSGAGAARGGPFQRFSAQRIALHRDAEMADIALDHRQVFVRAAAVKAEPQAEAIRQRDLLLD